MQSPDTPSIGFRLPQSHACDTGHCCASFKGYSLVSIQNEFHYITHMYIIIFCSHVSPTVPFLSLIVLLLLSCHAYIFQISHMIERKHGTCLCPQITISCFTFPNLWAYILSRILCLLVSCHIYFQNLDSTYGRKCSVFVFLNLLHGLTTAYFLYTFICWWTSTLIPYLGYCE